MNSEMSKGLQKQLNEMGHDDEPIKDIIVIIMVKEHMSRLNMAEHEVVIMPWNCLVDAVEWNKKGELVAEQAVKHIRTYSPCWPHSRHAAVPRSLSYRRCRSIATTTSIATHHTALIQRYAFIVLLFYKGMHSPSSSSTNLRL